MVLEKLAARLKQKGLKGMAETNLKLFRQLFLTYPQIRQTLSDELIQTNLQQFRIGDTEIFIPLNVGKIDDSTTKINTSLLVNQLSFSHFIELLKADTDTKRRFYEVHAIQNYWGVGDLKRDIETLLYERTGLSTDKEATVKNI